MGLQIVHQDITTMQTDAIVNATNSQLQQGGGVCGAIFQAAGAKELQKECNQIGRCEVGKAVITKGYHLDAPYIIHTVGPVWHDGLAGESDLLASAYRQSLELAKEHDLNSIAFPLISAGIYGYPKDEAQHIATDTINSFLEKNEMAVYLVLFP